MEIPVMFRATVWLLVRVSTSGPVFASTVWLPKLKLTFDSKTGPPAQVPIGGNFAISVYHHGSLVRLVGRYSPATHTVHESLGSRTPLYQSPQRYPRLSVSSASPSVSGLAMYPQVPACCVPGLNVRLSRPGCSFTPLPDTPRIPCRLPALSRTTLGRDTYAIESTGSII